MKIARRRVICLLPLFVSVLFNTPLAHSQARVTLSGSVMDQTGGAISGALVRLYSTRGLNEKRAASDAYFEFTNVDPGMYELEVTFPGFKTVAKNIEISDKTPAFLSIVLQEGKGGHCIVMDLGRPGESQFSAGADISYVRRVDVVDVKGMVRDDLGSALAGVTVKLEGSGPFRTTVSNTQGEFEFSGIEPGKYILASSQSGFHDISSYVWIMQENLARVIVTLPDSHRVPCFEDFGPGLSSDRH